MVECDATVLGLVLVVGLVIGFIAGAYCNWEDWWT